MKKVIEAVGDVYDKAFEGLTWKEQDGLMLGINKNGVAVVQVPIEVYRALRKKGVGDRVEQMTKFFGIPKCSSCEERRKAMNKVNTNDPVLKVFKGLLEAAFAPETINGKAEDDGSETGGAAEARSDEQAEAEVGSAPGQTRR